MCALFGIAGNITRQDINILYGLGVVSLLRGTDGAGACMGNTKTKKIESYKTKQDFLGLWWQIEDQKKSSVRSVWNNFVMGHDRWATVGSLDHDSAHPYEVGNLIGMHNGTIKSDHIIDKVASSTNPNGKNTDSEVLFNEIHEHGLEKALMDLNEDEDAYAISMFNREDSTITFVRNAKRTLSFAVNNKRDVMYWSSEGNMLRFVLDRENQDYDVYSVDERVVFTVDPDNITKGERSWTHEDLPEPIVREKKVVSKIFPVRYPLVNYQDSWIQNEHGRWVKNPDFEKPWWDDDDYNIHMMN